MSDINIVLPPSPDPVIFCDCCGMPVIPSEQFQRFDYKHHLAKLFNRHRHATICVEKLKARIKQLESGICS